MQEKTDNSMEILIQSIHSSLETYSNVHRGSGHHSMVTTEKYEQAREMVLEHLGLNNHSHVVIFTTPRRAETVTAYLASGSYHEVSSRETGLPLGVVALAVKRQALPREIPFLTGGGTARLVSPDRVIRAKAPDRFEAGTPSVIHSIALARGLQLLRKEGIRSFAESDGHEYSVEDILYRDELEGYTGNELLGKLRDTLIGKDRLVPTAAGMQPFINLDNAASTPTFEPIFRAAEKTMQLNGKLQQELIAEARKICAGFLHAPQETYDILFTSNTTESINLVAESLSRGAAGEAESPNPVPAGEWEPVIVNTLLEHNSNDLPWRHVPGATLLRVGIDENGFIDQNRLNALLAEYNEEGRHGNKRIVLVAVSGASNVLGIYNDLGEISRIVHASGARLLVDAAQLAAHRETDMEGWDADYLAFSAHKTYAPFGSGILAVRKGLLRFSPEEMNRINASGEENVAGIAALAKALLLLRRIGFDVIRQEEQALTARLLKGMALIPGIRILGINDPDSPEFASKGGVVAFEIKGLLAGRIARELAGRAGIGVRFGCHCAHLLVKRLLHIGPFPEKIQLLMVRALPKLNLPGVTRVSIGIENTEAEIDTFIRTLGEVASRSPYPGK